MRTSAGVIGWTSQDQLLSAEFWRQAQELEGETAKMPIEARGHTRVLTNLHIDPARGAARIRQLDKDVPVDLYERRAVVVPVRGDRNVAEAARTVRRWRPRKKTGGWCARTCRAPSNDELTLSGWLLGRFVDLDVPEPLPNYASSAGMRIVAWFELNHVIDELGATRPQYLVLGTRSGEGQPCDFTLMRVFTWGKQKDGMRRHLWRAIFAESSR